MTSLTTAKLLLFVALSLGPKEMTPSILITSNSDSIIWTQKSGAWNLVEKRPATHDWPANGMDISTGELNTVATFNKQEVREILHHGWKRDSVLVLSNGDRVEKQGTKAIYISRPGAANEKIYTILYIENGVPL